MNAQNSHSRPANRSSVQALLAMAAGAAVAALAASPAQAQYRVGADGHYNDANNRAGSGGYNQASDASYRSGLNTQIVNGTVSGLGYFHGNGQLFDPNLTQVNNEDQAVQGFTAISAPVNYASRVTGTSVYTPFYNKQNYNTQPSATLTTTANGVGYIPAPTASPLTPSTDTRLQNLNNSPTDLDGTNLATPGTLDQSGPVNNVGNQSLYSLSPLYGVREVQAGDKTQDNAFMSRYGDNRVGSGPRQDPDSIQEARSELEVAPIGDQKADGKDEIPPDNAGGGAANGTSSAAGVNGQQGRSDLVSGTSVPSAAVNSSALNPRQVSGTSTAYGSTQQNLLIPANQQSRQIMDLQKRFAAANPHPTLDQAANQTNRLILAKRAADAKLAAANKAGGDASPSPARAGSTGAVAPSGPATGGAIATTAHPESTGIAKPDLTPIVRDPADTAVGDPDKPFIISSLATGIKATGLSNLLRTAEGQMRAGQFGQAVDTYDTAGEVAPNNPFVPLGRGFAELGASYYGKAESDLTRAILTEPAVLAAQYDLKGFLGQDRLKFVQKDLADIGTTEQTARPYLLLAYIDHNTGADDATVTAKDLDLAESRGANKRLVDLMREAWNLKPIAAK